MELMTRCQASSIQKRSCDHTRTRALENLKHFFAKKISFLIARIVCLSCPQRKNFYSEYFRLQLSRRYKKIINFLQHTDNFPRIFSIKVQYINSYVNIFIFCRLLICVRLKGHVSFMLVRHSGCFVPCCQMYLNFCS